MSREPSTSCLEVNCKPKSQFRDWAWGGGFILCVGLLFSLDFFLFFLGDQFDVEVLSLKPPLQKCARIHVPTWRVVTVDGFEATRR